MTIEDVLQRRMKEILLKETPYVLEEARYGMFDLAVYVPEEVSFEGLTESSLVSAVRACNKYLLDGTCTDRKKSFLANFEPVHDEQCLLAGFMDKAAGTMISEKELNNLMTDRKTIKTHISCNAGEHLCTYLEKRISTEQSFTQGLRLSEGLHLIEFKSDHDDVNRFLEQLPHYAMLADYIWLVLGSRQKEPKWLPSYVGLFRETDDGFTLVKNSEYHKRLPPLSVDVLRESGLPNIKGEQYYAFLRKWFINSIFYRREGLVVPMHELDGVLKEPEKNGKQSRLF